MEIFKSVEEIEKQSKRVILTIGTFDGIHKGHDKLIDTVIDFSKKEDASPWVFTFSNLPYEIFNPEINHYRLIDIESKTCVLSKKGIEGLILIDFTKNFGKLNGIDFFRSLREKFVSLKIVVGYDFRMGRGSSISASDLEEISKLDDFEIHIVPPIKEDGQKISSTWIRSLIKQGDIKKANALLARPYFITGKVEKREGKGSEIGFPTANIRNSKMVYPKPGVYLTKVQIAGDENNEFGQPVYEKEYYSGMTFVGKSNLSFQNPPAVETNIFDFSGNLYNKNIKVYFLKRIREIIKLENFDELRNQLIKDKEECLSLLKKPEEIDVNY